MSRTEHLKQLKATVLGDLTKLCKYFQSLTESSDPLLTEARYHRLSCLENYYFELFLEILEYNAEVKDPSQIVLVDDKEQFLELIKTSMAAYHQFENNRSLMPTTIRLPQFDGSIGGWVEFRTVFDSLVHSNTTLTDDEKLHFLRLGVKGQATSVFSEARDYPSVYDALINRYENPRRLMNFYLQQIIDYKTTAYLNPRRFLIVHETAVNALKSLEVDNLADFLLFQLMYSNLDSSTRKSFDSNQDDTNAIPQAQDLLEFVRRKAELYREAQSNAVSHDALSLFTGGAASTPYARRTRSIEVLCEFCNNRHFLAQCPTFRGKSIIQRLEFVKIRNLCINCLGYHLLTNCMSSKTCRQCEGRHHYLLHIPHRRLNPMLHDQFIPSNALVNYFQFGLDPFGEAQL